MGNALDFFKGNAPKPKLSEEMHKRLMEITGKGVGGSSGPRISIKGARFRMIIGGEQVAKRKEDWMDVLILDLGKINRTYYKDAYNSDTTQAPSCWSPDSERPDPSVPHPMAKKCDDCPMNVKGSGQRESRACRFSQRIALVLPGDEEQTVYSMSLPATSLFGGDGRGDDLPFQGYMKLLKNNSTAVQYVITRMYFDDESETPKLFFKPGRFSEPEEVEAAMELIDSEEVTDAITLNVISRGGEAEVEQHTDTDDTPDEAPAEKPKKKKKAKKPEPEVEEDEKVEEPKVRKTKKVDDEDVEDAPKAKKLASVLDGWDDDEDEDED